MRRSLFSLYLLVRHTLIRGPFLFLPPFNFHVLTYIQSQFLPCIIRFGLLRTNILYGCFRMLILLAEGSQVTFFPFNESENQTGCDTAGCYRYNCKRSPATHKRCNTNDDKYSDYDSKNIRRITPLFIRNQGNRKI